MVTKIWLSSPHMGGNEQNFVQQAFDGNWIAPLGPNVTGFEKDIESYLDANVYAAALSSGTAALHLGLILLGVQKGDEVICQSFTFAASANPIIYLGAAPVFVDSEPETWNICPNALEDAVKSRIAKGKKPKAIIAVHLYGMPYKVNEINSIAQKYNIPVLEDSAEALGSKYYDKPCGTLGDISVLSFNGNKIITTSGGGALITRDAETKNKAVFLATQARDDAPYYQHSTIGYNYRMSNVCAGIGRGQMLVLDDHVAGRRNMNAFYASFFNTINGVEVHKEKNDSIFSNHWLTTILIDAEVTGGKTAEGLRLAFNEEDIESRPLWKPLHLQPVFKDYPYYGSDIAQQLFDIGLCLPSGSNLGEYERQRIYKAMSKFFN
ncbi:DegT/DnrJ/EryC1/StrS family aminotransferase [Flavobacterium sp. Sd200]|uniref:DegT/DnrJ/EryC1/StrS family aminotransferase n=1 Tax=Flavobacterium sp. Sd200 TaxID=2692211 RepID=UPI00351B299A